MLAVYLYKSKHDNVKYVNKQKPESVSGFGLSKIMTNRANTIM